MNVERITQLRDFLQALPDEKFNMSSLFKPADVETYRELAPTTATEFVHQCGTAACIAGWAITLFDPFAQLPAANSGLAEELLDLTSDEGFELFVPEGYHNADRFSRTAAIATLTNLLATGEVNWDV